MIKAQARMRKCDFCNGAGHFYPIDEGPLRECQICNGLGLLKVKVLPKRPKGHGRPRDAKVDPGRPSQSSSYLAGPEVAPLAASVFFWIALSVYSKPLAYDPLPSDILENDGNLRAEPAHPQPSPVDVHLARKRVRCGSATGPHNNAVRHLLPL